MPTGAFFADRLRPPHGAGVAGRRPGLPSRRDREPYGAPSSPASSTPGCHRPRQPRGVGKADTDQGGVRPQSRRPAYVET